MGPTSMNRYDTSQPGEPTPKPKRNIVHLLLQFVRKYWYAVILLFVVVTIVAAWQIMNAREAAAWQKAHDYFEKADYENAGKVLEDMSLPKDEDDLRVYAQTMLATSNLDKALNAYTRLYDMTNDQSTQLVIGNIYNQQKKYDEAIKIYQDVIDSNTSNVQAYVNLATVYRLQNKLSEASAVADEAVKNNPNNVVLLELKVSMLMDDKESEAFKQSVEELRAVNPEDPLLQALNQ